MACSKRCGRGLTLLPAIRAAVRESTSGAPIAEVGTLDRQLERSMARTAFTLTLIGIAAAVALLLALVGVYGLVAFLVAQRTREIGVRMAVGASRRDIGWMVVRQGGLLAVGGVATGVLTAAVLAHLMTALLHGVRPVDPPTYGLAAVTLLSLTIIACWLPARRASRVDPLLACGRTNERGTPGETLFRSRRRS